MSLIFTIDAATFRKISLQKIILILYYFSIQKLIYWMRTVKKSIRGLGFEVSNESSV